MNRLIAEAVLMALLIFCGHEWYKSAQNFTVYKAQLEQQGRDQHVQNLRDQASADAKLGVASALLEVERASHRGQLDDLHGELRGLQATLASIRMSGAVADRSGGQDGRASSGEAGNIGDGFGPVADALEAVSAACLATAEHQHHIIASEPNR